MTEFDKQLADLLRLSAERAVTDELGRTMGQAAATPASSTSKASSQSQGVGSTVANAVLDGMGLGPIVRGLLSLFGGGEDEVATALPKYLAPGAVGVNAGTRRNAGSPVAIDYGQNGE